MRQFFLVFLLISFFMADSAFAQEGTKQLMPNSTDQLWLEIAGGTNSAFAAPGCAEHNRLNIYLKAGEKLFFGLQESDTRNYTIRKPDGTAVTGHSNVAIPSTGAGYIASYDEAVTGAEGTILNGITVGAAGYSPLSFTADQTGDYYIEFSGRTYIQRFDFTVTDASNNVVTNSDNPNVPAGRLWSRGWNLETNSFTLYPVNAYFYVFTSDEFVNKVKFEIIPNSFSFVCNSFGTNTSGYNFIKNAQSQTYNVATDDIAEYRIFLNDPDHTVFLNSHMAPPKVKVWFEETLIYDYDYLRSPTELDVYDQSIQIPIDKNEAACGLPNAAVFKIESNVDGWSTIYVDIDGGGFDVDGQDTVIVADVKVGDNYIIWDMKDRNGNFLPDGTYSCSATFLGRGPAHFPLSDVETISSITTQSIRPFNKLGVTLYWDDKLINTAGQWGDDNGNMDESQVTQLTFGKSIPRISTYFQDNGGFENGDQNTLNSWFNAIDLGLTFFEFTVATQAGQCLDGALPVVSDITVSGPRNSDIAFTQQNFLDKFFSPNSYDITKIKITSLPSDGILKYSGTPIVIGDLPYEITKANIGNLTYTPNTDWGGEDSFAWNGHNGIGYATNDAIVHCNINASPTISSIATQNLCISSSLSNLAFTVTDADGDPVLISVYSHNTTLVPNENITINGTGTDRTISVTPAGNETGSATIFIQADDGLEQSLSSFILLVGPSLSFTGSTEICVAEDLQLVAEEIGATSYTWKRGATTVGTTKSLDISSPVTTGSYSLTIVKSGCTATNNFEVSSYPNFAFSGETTVCSGNNANLSALETVASSYSWRKGGLEIGSQKALDYTLGATASDFSLEVTKFGCTTTSPDFTLTASGSPDVSNFSTSVSNNCISNTAEVTVTSSSLLNATYTVTYDLSGNNSASGSTATLDFSNGSGTFNTSSLANSGSTTVAISNIKLASGSCNTNVSAGNSANLTVNPLPNVSNLSLNTLGGCIGSAASISLSSSSLTDGDYELTYSLSGTNVGVGLFSDMNSFSSASGSFNTTALDNTGSTTLTLLSIENITTGCSNTVSSNNTQTLTVAPPSVGGSVAGDATVCAGINSTGFTLSGHTGSIVKWQSSTASDFTVGPTDIANTTTTMTATNLSTTTYYRALVQSGSCAVAYSGTGTVTVNALDDASFGYGSASYCVSDTDPTPTISGLAGGTFSAGAGLSINSSTGVIDVSASTPGTYSVAYTTSGSCPNTSNESVTISGLDDASFGYGSASYCVSDTDPTPTISGLAGGTFSAGAGLSINSSTGVIDVSASTPGTYSVAYTTSGSCPNTSNESVTISGLDDASFGYVSASYCMSDTDPTPTISGLAGGTFSAGAGLPINSSTGVIDVSASTPGTYSVTYTTSGSCLNTSNVAVTVNALPVAAAITGDTEACMGSTITNLSSMAGTIVWSSSNTGVATINSSTGVVTPVSAGGTNINYTVTDGNSCSSTSTAHAVTVNALPVAAAITGDTEVCMGSTITNLSSMSGTIVWSSSNTAIATINLSTGVVTPVSAGSTNISYTVTDGNSCSSTSAAHAVTVNALPVAAAITGDTEVCMGSTITNLSSMSGTIVWSSSNTGVATINSSTGVVTPVSVGSNNISYTVTDGNSCSSTSAAHAVTVNALPVAAAITGDTEVCMGSAITNLSSMSGTIVWSSSNTAIATINSSTGVVTPVSAGSTNITYTVTDGNSCSSTSAAHAVTVNALPVAAAITGATEVCMGSTITNLISMAGTIVWASSNTGVATINSSTGVVTPVSAGSANISYTVTDGNSCSTTSAAHAVTVNALPVAAAITGDTEVCMGSTITNLNSMVGTIVWSSSNTGVATINSSTGVVTPVSAGGTNITYTVTDGNSCSSTSAAPAVTVNALPLAAAITGDTEVCIGSTITNLSSMPGTIVWSSSNTAIATINSSTGVVTPVSAGSTNITYTVTDGNSCSSTSAAHAVTVNALPVAAAITGDTEVCMGSTITNLSSMAGTIVWSSSNTAIATINSSTGVVTLVSAGSTNITYTVTDGNSCSSTSAAHAVTVNALPVAAAITGDTEVCMGSTITNLSSMSGTIVWSSSNSAIATINSSTGVVTPVSAGNTNITYTVTDGNSCSATSAVHAVTVNALPVAAAITGDTEVCIGSTITNLSSMAGTIVWSSSNTGVATINSSTGVVTPVSAGSTNISYTVTDGNSCSSTSAAYAVTVNALPVAAAITGDTEVCMGSTITNLSSMAGTIVWSSSNTGVATINSSTGVVTPVSAGGTNITYTVTDGNSCSTTSAAHAVTVNALPVAAAITGDTEVCMGSTITNLSSMAGTIVWSSSNTGVATINLSTGVVTPVSAGSTNITYTVTDGNSCSSTSAGHAVMVNALPAAAVITGDTEVCMGSTITNLSSMAGTIVWSSSNTGVATINSSTGVVTPVSAGSTNITYTVTDGNSCSSTSAAHAVTVNALPLASALTGDTDMCLGSTITNLSSSAGAIVWSSSNTGVATINSGTGVVTSVSAGSSNLSYTVTDANNCTSTSADHGITVNALPTISGTNTVTTGSDIILTSTGGAGTWLSSNPFIATVDATGKVTGVAPGSISISFTLASTGCYTSHSVGVGCTPPSPMFTVETSSACVGSSGIVYTTEAGKNNYTWSISAGGAISSGGTSTDNSVTVSWNTAGAQTVSINYEDGGCSAPSPTISNVTVNAIPTLALGSSNDPGNCITSDGSIVLNLTNVADGVYNIDYIDGTSSPQVFTNVPVIGGIATIGSLDADVYNDLTISSSSCASTENIDVTLFCSNIAPVATDDLNNSTAEDTPITVSVIGSNDMDVDGNVEPSTIVLSDPNDAANTGDSATPLVIIGVGTYTVDAVGNVSFTPEANFTGTADVNYTIEDNEGLLSNVAQIAILVNSVNDAPVAIDDLNNSTPEDTPITVSVIGSNDTDVDGNVEPATIILIDPNNVANTGDSTTPLVIVGVGTYAVDATGNVTFTPATDFSGTADVNYTIEDNDGLLSNVAQVAILVNPVNDAPVAIDDLNNSTPEDTPITVSVIGSNDTDVDGNVEPSTIVLSDPNDAANTGDSTTPLVIAGVGTYTVDATGSVTFTPATDFNGTADVNYTIEDNDGLISNIAQVAILVNPVNDAPIAGDDVLSESVDENGVLLGGNLLANDSDPDGDVLTITAIPVVDVANGILVIHPDGTYRYTPNAGYTGLETFTYEVCDGNGGCITATVTITILPANNDVDGDGISNEDEGNGDTDGDGIPDYQDTDSDNDGIPDEDEGDEDTDSDGIPDYIDLDSDEDGISDEEEGNEDIDEDGIPNSEDPDSDGDGIPDEVEGNIDTDDDGTPDYKDLDSDDDGIPDEVEGNIDTDDDGIPDYKDLDSDNDGIPDEDEGNIDTDDDGIPDYKDLDSDDDGIPDEDEGNIDTDDDGIPDYKDLDSDNDGIPDEDEGNIDTDDDGIPDYKDLDSDNDGIPDEDEGDEDTDADGIPDYIDLDSDDDGITDEEEGDEDIDEDGIPNSKDPDSDNDGIPDTEESEGDCDEDEIPNYLDNDPCDVIVPIGFSPNGDGENDYWLIEGIKQYAGNKVKVFNRWGNLVYEKDGYDNEIVVWTGQSEGKITIGGNEVTDGSYFYVIELGDGRKPLKGYVVVKR